MEANPEYILKASIILGAKLEEINFDPKVVFEKLDLKTEEQQKKIVQYELRILKSLEFKLLFIPFE